MKYLILLIVLFIIISRVNIIRLKMKVLGKIGDIFEELEKAKK